MLVGLHLRIDVSPKPCRPSHIEESKGESMEIDIEAINAELSTLTPEQMKQQLLDAKVKQKVNQKKYHNPETAKRARMKKAAEMKALSERAKSLPATKPGYANLYEQINAEANELAQAKLDEQDAEGIDEEESAA